jgi:hypothetical protein
MDNLNLQDFVKRISGRILIVLLISLLVFAYLYSRPVTITYMTTVGAKVELENIQSLQTQSPDDLIKGVTSEVAYNQLTGVINKYLFTQVTSIPFQQKFLNSINEPTPSTIDKKLLYDVLESSAPYIYINYKTTDKEKIKLANKNLKELIINEVPKNWNLGKNDKYKIKAFVLSDDTIIEQPTGLVQRILPAIYTFFGLFFLSILIPIGKKNNLV